MWTAEGKSKSVWQHTSAVLSLIANVNRDPKKQSAFEPGDFNPYEQKPKAVLEGKDLRILKDVFVKPEERTR